MGTADVWLVDTAAAPAARLVGLLDDAELARLRGLTHAAGARRYVAAHAAMRLIVADRLGLPCAAVRWRLTRHGKPEPDGLPAGLRVNLSHAGRYAAVAIAMDRPVGVDIEEVRQDARAIALARRYFPPAEAEAVAACPPARAAELFYRLWTRKEACVKASGARIADGLCLPVGTPERTAGPVRVRADGGRLRDAAWRVADVPAPDGYAASVALLGDGPGEVRTNGLVDWGFPSA